MSDQLSAKLAMEFGRFIEGIPWVAPWVAVEAARLQAWTGAVFELSAGDNHWQKLIVVLSIAPIGHVTYDVRALSVIDPEKIDPKLERCREFYGAGGSVKFDCVPELIRFLYEMKEMPS